ncbi:hypothetical protein [Paraburkholderia bannensis]|uniref:hypothetical protein n=1 Tax=Paraburkholderia bannensis TaxID=765414 RepID=UPI0012EBA8A3|nr:hypothetical protein [Paraburkholderia bannensis]
MNMLQKILVATVIAIPGVALAQSDASAIHFDTSANPSSWSIGKTDYTVLRQPTEASAKYEKQRPEQRSDVVLSTYSPPIYVVKQ